jgi:hypothetical protein
MKKIVPNFFQDLGGVRSPVACLVSVWISWWVSRTFPLRTVASRRARRCPQDSANSGLTTNKAKFAHSSPGVKTWIWNPVQAVTMAAKPAQQVSRKTGKATIAAKKPWSWRVPVIFPWINYVRYLRAKEAYINAYSLIDYLVLITTWLSNSGFDCNLFLFECLRLCIKTLHKSKWKKLTPQQHLNLGKRL